MSINSIKVSAVSFCCDAHVSSIAAIRGIGALTVVAADKGAKIPVPVMDVLEVLLCTAASNSVRPAAVIVFPVE